MSDPTDKQLDDYLEVVAPRPIGDVEASLLHFEEVNDQARDKLREIAALACQRWGSFGHCHVEAKRICGPCLARRFLLEEPKP